jgi:hypothetical protein
MSSLAYAGKMFVNRKRKVPSRYVLRGRGVIASRDRKAEQLLSKALARNPLVLLDQQLQSQANEDDNAIRKRGRC